jgi:hypothetical protein
MSTINKAIKKAAKPYAQDIAEKLNVHKIYLDELLAESDDTAAAKNALRSYQTLHSVLEVAATEGMGLKITHDDAETGDFVVFSGGGSKTPPPPTGG